MGCTVGTIVLAKAGRDADGLFFVVGATEGFLLLADGKRRKLEHPKRKNPAHLSEAAQGSFDHPVIKKLKEGNPVSNRELRKALAAFKEGITLG